MRVLGKMEVMWLSMELVEVVSVRKEEE